MKIGAFVICLVYIFAGSVLLGRRGASTGHTLSLSMCRYRSSRKSEHQSSKCVSIHVEGLFYADVFVSL